MRCPKCKAPAYLPAGPCPTCHFEGDPALVEELAHLTYLLNEIDTWQNLGISQADRQHIHQTYLVRRRQIEVALGLRLPPFSAEEARQAWPDVIQRETLLEKVADWTAAGLVDPALTSSMITQARSQIQELLEQLAGHARPAYPVTRADRLEVVTFLLEAVDYLRRNSGFTSPQAEAQVKAPLLAEKERLETKLGLRSEPEPAGQPADVPDTEPAAPPTPQPAPAEPLPEASLRQQPPAPRIPFRERLWRSLLSERTLHAILFMGILLLFAAALSFVIWGWKDFSPMSRVAIPTGFTLLFFGLGWLVRSKTALYRSGIALSAIAALLIPIDFYTVYVNFNIPPDYWPAFWLVTSLACLGAYTLAALAIQSRFFGYLVGTAAGSTVLAAIEVGHQTAGLSLDWRAAGLSLLSLGLIILGTILGRQAPAQKWRTFAAPFRYLALLTVGVLMPLTFGWRFIDRPTYDTLHYALTLTWWVGGFIFGWGAIFHRSRSLGLLAAISLPVAVYLAQAAIFDLMAVNPAWHAFGWAWLVPLYFVAGYKLLANKEDPIIHGHGRTATGWGIALLIVATLWSLTDLTSGAAAASSHAILSGTVVLAALLWRRPAYLYGASLLAFSATTFAMTELNLSLAQLSVGWASLALLHIILALNLGARFPIPLPNYARVLVISGYTIAGLALLPPLLPYEGDLLAYSLGNWLGLAAWGAWLAHRNQPGFAGQGFTIPLFGKAPRSTRPLFHWLTAIPLPIWLWLLFANRRPLDFGFPLALAALAWAMVLLGYRLARTDSTYRYPWHLIGGMVSLGALVAAFLLAPTGFTPALTLLVVGLLYLADAVTGRQSGELAIAGLVIAWGYLLLLDRLGLPFDAVTSGLAGLIALYILAGLQTERRKSAIFTHRFLAPLYLTAHLLALYLLWRVYVRPFDHLLFDMPWTDTVRLWAASAQLLLGFVYGLYAWNTYKERWGHAAAWLGAAAGGFIAITYSTGRGSSAAKAALIAIAFVLAERALHRLRHRPGGIKGRWQALLRLAWPLYRRPLLAAGWTISAVAIGLALIRNLWLLGGGRIQQLWAVVGLLLIVGLYTLSVRLFRQARFGWLAALLMFAPWTILTSLGWFTLYRPTVPGFALSWTLLAWLLFLLGLSLSRLTPPAYRLPLKTTAHVLLPFSLLWAIADVDTSRFTFGLAVGLYGLAAWVDYRRFKIQVRQRATLGATKFLYPALGLIPVWSVYVMAWLLPTARHEHYGLMLLMVGPLGLLAGQALRRVAPEPKAAGSYALPAYLTAYGATLVGTLLVAHLPSLLALALLFDTLLLLISARLFRNPLWLYPAAALVPVSLLLSLHEANIPVNRHGWWLIALAAMYLAIAWALRRARLPAYATGVLALGFALIALGLPPSSRDQIGAMVGYGAAALLYGITAFWLRQPLLLTPACALILVPYAVGLQRSALSPAYYGLALFPGAILALTLGYGLEVHFGRSETFPWRSLTRWPAALANRLATWWSLPLYTLGLGLAAASPFFTAFRPDLTALNFLLLMPIFGWATSYFRLRLWLLATALAGHLAVVYYLEWLGWWRYPPWAWLRFLPVTIITAVAALFIERRWKEGSPLHPARLFAGWSRPLYLLLFLDLLLAQMLSLSGTWPAITITLIHTGLLAILASLWLAPWLAYLSQLLGVVALVQAGAFLQQPIERLPVALAQLALAYGLAGYGLAWFHHRLPQNRVVRPRLNVWEVPLQRFSLGLSFITLLLAGRLGIDLAGWTVRAMLGLPFREIVDLATVQMVVGVLSLLGLLYLATAFTHRWLRLAYLALGMLLAGWLLYAFYIQQWDRLAQVQWYAIPAGIYLLGISYLEWQRGHKTLARWLDYAALFLMMGSLFWQTLLFGPNYALLLGLEGLAILWWGSARRLRRLFYAGMAGTILAVLGQLINALSSINQWIVFGVVGLLLVAVAIFVERKLEDIKLWQEKVLETWE